MLAVACHSLSQTPSLSLLLLLLLAPTGLPIRCYTDLEATQVTVGGDEGNGTDPNMPTVAQFSFNQTLGTL